MIRMSDPGRHAAAFAALPRDPAAVASAVQGLLVHERLTGLFGGRPPTPERLAESHIRPLATQLDRLLARDARPLAQARTVDEKLLGTCRDFSLATVAGLRVQGWEARCRVGFATYFEEGHFVDHWVVEYRPAASATPWRLLDAELCPTSRRHFGIAFDPLDVPRTEFLVAGDAWQRCRRGEADPTRFGLLDMNGLWFIASNIVRDVAALAGCEMLPWDVWGAMSGPDSDLDLPFLDRLAALTLEPDAPTTELLSLARDPRLAVPSHVFNAVRERVEAVDPAG